MMKSNDNNHIVFVDGKNLYLREVRVAVLKELCPDRYKSSIVKA